MGFQIRPRRVGVAIGACVAALAVAACGGSGSTTSSKTTGGGTTTASHSGFATAIASNTKFERRPTSIGITTPVGAAIPTGKVVDFIQCGVPACTVEGDILQDATNQLGWKLVRINAGSTPQTIVAAYQQAIQNKPNAVVGSGYPRVLFNPEVKTLKSMNIPVLEAFTADSTGNGIYVVGGPVTNHIQGQEVADYMLANTTDKSATLGTVIPSGFPNMIQENASFNGRVKSVCSTCAVKSLTVPVTSIGTDLPTRTTTFLTANPSIKSLWMGYDDMVGGMPVALKGASITDLSMTTISMNATVKDAITSGQYVDAGIGTSFPEVYWREIDLLARMFAHKSFSVDLNDATLPYWTITKSNIPSNAGSTTFANVVDYRQQFMKLWGKG